MIAYSKELLPRISLIFADYEVEIRVIRGYGFAFPLNTGEPYLFSNASQSETSW